MDRASHLHRKYNLIACRYNLLAETKTQKEQTGVILGQMRKDGNE